MNNTLKNILTIGIPSLILIAIIITVLKVIKGEGDTKHPECPSGLQRYDDGECLQCDPADKNCAVCTGDGDCQHGGTCYMDESQDGTHGVCQCTPGWSGQKCQSFCQNSGDCNNQPCVDGVCQCGNNMAPPDCKNPPDSRNCSAPNCNSIIITQMQVTSMGITSIGAPTELQIMCDEDLGENYDFGNDNTITLGGFPDNWNINGVTLGVYGNGTTAVPNTEEKCWYYCENGRDDCGEDAKGSKLPAGGGAWPPIPGGQNSMVDRCDPPGSVTAKCFPRGCPKYTVIKCFSNDTEKLSKIFTVNKPRSYNDWQTTAYFKFTPTNPQETTCFNHTTNGDGDTLCEACIKPWGPGKDVMDVRFPGAATYPLGICGRRINDYPIQIAAKDANDGTDNNTAQQKCTAAFGNSSCASGTCEPGSHVDRQEYVTCNTTNFWSYPGSNCQTGTWNTCDQCGSTDGQNEQDNFFSKKFHWDYGCGAVLGSGSQIKCPNAATTPATTTCCGKDCYEPVNLLPKFPQT